MSSERHAAMPVVVLLVGLSLMAVALVKGGSKRPLPLASITTFHSLGN